MPKLLQIDFEFKGPFGEEMAEGLHDLAVSINQEPGLIWKIWTENKEKQEAGGIYLFENEETARAYLEMHAARLRAFGVNEVNAKIFDVNEPLSKINKGSV
ncbi:monooxygenase [Thiomicrorhabdus sp. ZW0627]|uniref:monooxygenase n=1 Tax=Thiomicrorhabdus sp. ZW0627 TaxID=3039774 RepID=UPI002436CC44|nr:monooxygenase [Thiomicrorhabdus sp. ZW0627]MDG6772862.1 monooxygenase [Thiomicrorhabdus sp. ZW0627]